MQYRTSYGVAGLVSAAICIAQPGVGWSQVASAPDASDQGRTAQDDSTSSIPDTIMFTIDELNEIKSRISSGTLEEDESQGRGTFGEETLYLQSILYYGPAEWTIWLNGTPVGPNDEFQSFQITETTPRYVQLLVPLSAQGMRPVRLEPNQTFITESGIIVEGKYN